MDISIIQPRLLDPRGSGEPSKVWMDSSGASWWTPWVSSVPSHAVKLQREAYGAKLALSRLLLNGEVFLFSTWTPPP